MGEPWTEERREALGHAVMDFIGRGYGAVDDPLGFEALAREVFDWQYTRIEPYRRLCEAYGKTPASITSWRDIPAVPTESFKEQNLFAYGPGESVRVFRTSGTTQGFKGNHFFKTLRVYDRALWSSFSAMVLPDGASDLRLCFLIQSPSDIPDSSLAHMLGTIATRLGAAQRPFMLDSGGLKLKELEHLLDAAYYEATPVLICTTAFALARFLESTDRSWRLARGTRVMETGGFKGHTTTYDRDSLYAAIGDRLNVPATHIVSEYGMTELSSQTYSTRLRASLIGDVPPDVLLAPPWMPVRMVDPESGTEVEHGNVGLIQFFDLANIDSISAIYTADQGRMREGGGFELLGRLPDAERRGCSLAASELLGEAGEPEGLLDDED